MLHKSLATAAVLTALALPATSFADFDNMLGGMYMNNEDDSDLALSVMGVVGSHYLGTVDTSGLALEAPFMQRIGFVSVAVGLADGDIGTDLPAEGNMLFVDSAVPLSNDLFLGLSLARTDLTLDTSALGGGDIHARESRTGLRLGYYLHTYTALTLGYEAKQNSNDNLALGSSAQDTTSIQLQSLLYNAGGHSFKFVAKAGKTNGRGDDDADAWSLSARYFPVNRIGIELGMQQVKYELDTTPDKKTLSVGVDAYVGSSAFVSISYDSESQSGANGVDGSTTMVMASWLF